MKDKIVIMDSGIGGISLLKNLFRTFYFFDFIYFADTKNIPYGEKNKKQLLEITINNINLLIKKYNPKIFIFGCNTLSTTILYDIKQIFKDRIFFGIKPNLVESIKYVKNHDAKVLILATNKTIDNLKVDIYYNKNKENFKLCKMNYLASKIEKYPFNTNVLVPYLNKKLKKYNNIDCVILGCTHYYFVKDLIKKYFKNASIIDGQEVLLHDIKNYLINNRIFLSIKLKYKFKLVFNKETIKNFTKLYYINIKRNKLKFEITKDYKQNIKKYKKIVKNFVYNKID